MVGFGIGFGSLQNKKSKSTFDVVITALAHRLYGPGHSTGSAPPTGDGTAKSYVGTFINDSGASISTASVVLQGWTLTTSGTTNCSANFAVTGTVEFPVGTPVGTITSTTVTPGNNVTSASFTLSTPITAGGTFKVNLASTPGNGNTYISNLGFAGLRNHALKSTQRKLRLAGFGDSIMTNNNGALINAATSKCPVYLNSISGTTSQAYGSSAAANFAKQIDVCSKLGVTHIVSNFGTNDAGAGTALATFQGYLNAMRDATRVAGMKFVQTTMLPRTLQTSITVTSLSGVSTTATAVVPDGTKFAVGRSYVVSGANESAFNTIYFCTGITSNTLTLLFPGGGTTATGTITISAQTPSADLNFMTSFATFYNPGSGSDRGLFNAWVRGGNFDDYMEWADACEHSRDNGLWKVHGDDALLAETQLITVSSIISTSRFNSDYSRGNNTIANGFVQALTGANIGQFRLGNGNTAGDITVTAAWGSTQQIGDQYWAWPGSSYMSDDGTHPRVSVGGVGGQPHLDNAVGSWLDARL